MEYLQNYLSVLPQYDRSEVEQLIQENMELFETKVITKEEFEVLLAQLSNRKEKVTKLEPTGEMVDAEHLNRMHSNVYLDLKRLYQSHLIVEKVIANYNRILQGTLDDIQREIDTLSRRVQDLDLKAKAEDGLVIKSYGFEEKDKTLFMETDRAANENLFLDRNGEPLPSATLARNYHQHFLSLPVTKKTSAIQDGDGNTTATITVISSHKPEQVITDANHPASNAIDASSESYWAQAVITTEPAYSVMTKH